jgi:hypothetical protein
MIVTKQPLHTLRPRAELLPTTMAITTTPTHIAAAAHHVRFNQELLSLKEWIADSSESPNRKPLIYVAYLQWM